MTALRKVYRVAERKGGLLSALWSLAHRETKEVVAVEGLTFRIEAGERVGFLGPNGAGKTTTLKMLAGLLHPTSGEVRVGVHIPKERKADYLDSVTLVLGQKQQLLWDLPPKDTFELNRAIYAIPEAAYAQRLGALVEMLSLAHIVNTPTRELSLGERMKCELVAALLHEPKVLFLDEPTIGLDVDMQSVVRRFVREYNERTGATLLLTSHDMDDVSALCPRILVIAKGRLIYDGTVTELVRRVRPEKRIRLVLEARAEASELSRYGRVIEHHDEGVVLSVPEAEVSSRAQALLGHFAVRDLEVTRPPLDEVLSELFAEAALTRGVQEPDPLSGERMR